MKKLFAVLVLLFITFGCFAKSNYEWNFYITKSREAWDGECISYFVSDDFVNWFSILYDTEKGKEYLFKVEQSSSNERTIKKCIEFIKRAENLSIRCEDDIKYYYAWYYTDPIMDKSKYVMLTCPINFDLFEQEVDE